jgi:hypothetical protein
MKKSEFLLLIGTIFLFSTFYVVYEPALAQQSGGCVVGIGIKEPAPGASGVSPTGPLTLKIEVDVRSSGSSTCVHRFTKWQIASNPSFDLSTLVFDTNFDPYDLTSITERSLSLKPNTTYWWRAKVHIEEYQNNQFIDSYTYESPVGSFTTSGGTSQPSPGGPMILFINPTSGGPGMEVEVVGQGFEVILDPNTLTTETSVVLFDGNPVPTTFVDNTRLKFTVPANAACGTHTVQVRNPVPPNVLFPTPQVSNAVNFEVLCALPPQPPAPPSQPQPQLQITALTPTSGPPGTSVIVTGTGFEKGGVGSPIPIIIPPSEVLFDGQPVSTAFISNTQLRFTVPANAACGAHTVQVRTPSPAIGGQPSLSNTMTFTVTQPCGGAAQPPAPGVSPLKRFDTNNNDLIDDNEFFQIIDAWIAGTLDNPTFFKAVDLWVAQKPISSASLNGTFGGIQARFTSNAVLFTAYSPQAAEMALNVYDLNGQLIFARVAKGTSLRWGFERADGRKVANGVYLYTVELYDPMGRLLSRKVDKLVVLR